MLCVEIDELVPCLTDNENGEVVETEVIRIKRRSFLSKYNPKTNWYVNWAQLLDENEVYAVVVKGTVAIQGLVAIRPDKDMQAVFVTWMVAAPHNNPEMLGKMSKRYNGVGGHLFAVAVKRSVDFGFGGAITGFAADKKLMYHYCSAFHAEAICMLHPYQIFIPEEEGMKIQEVYNYDWTDEII
ncbi:MAG: hypothetical protein ACI4FY_06030 [Acetatifactor sp.]